MLKLNSVGHSVAGKTLFSDLSFSLINKKYGLVGPNGVGKTTLAKILVGEVLPTAGHIIKSGHVTYFAQNEVPSEALLSDYLMPIWETQGQYAELTAGLMAELDLARKTNELSGGEWMRARLLKLLSGTPGFLILDEPSNNLDRDGKSILLNFINRYQEGLLLISHDKELLERMDSILELSNQGITSYGGGFSFYWHQRNLEREQSRHKMEELKRESKKSERERTKKIASQEQRMRAGVDRVTKEGMSRIEIGIKKRTAQVSMGKLQTREKGAVEESKTKATDAWENLKTDPFLRLNFEAAEVPTGRTLISINQLNFQFSHSTNELWKSPINLTIKGSERWHLLGRNASGKSTLVKMIMDDLPVGGKHSGNIKKNASAIGYLDQKYSQLDPKVSIIDSIQPQSRFNETELRNELAFYGFTGSSVFQKVDTLSGGELLKASLAQIFLSKQIPEIIILDEPTNNLDLLSVGLLESALRNFRGAILVVSHDSEFVGKLGITHSQELER